MNTTRNILIALILNLSFSIFELIGGLLTGSIAITSDAIHDFGDAFGIGIALYLEKKSKHRPDSAHTFGYARYSILGAAITTLILIFGSAIIIISAIDRLLEPAPVDYDKMIILGIIGVVANSIAAIYTHKGTSLNQKSVNLHMLDDVLGWVVILIGSILMHFTNLAIIDPLMSIGVALFILFSATKNFRAIIDLFLEKTPESLSPASIKRCLRKLPHVLSVRRLRIWSLDGNRHCATLKIITDQKDPEPLKSAIRNHLSQEGVTDITIETEYKPRK